MIDKEYFHHFNYIKKEDMTGSMQGMRYMLRKETSEAGEDVLAVTIWPGPYCFAKTPPEARQRKEFAFSADGVAEAADWLNEQYVAQKPLWDSAKFF